MSPRRLQSNTRLWCYRFLVLRDGERCARCYEDFSAANNGSAAKNPLEIDHIDGDPFNWKPDNLRLLCKKCNVTLENSARPGRRPDLASSATCEREREEGKASTRVTREALDFRSPDAPTTMQANFLYELDFRRWLLQAIQEKGFIPKQDAINSGAEVVGCSPLTTARYIAKLTSSVGVLNEVRDMLGETVLVLKDHLKPEETILVDLDQWQARQEAQGRRESARHTPAHQEEWSESEAE